MKALKMLQMFIKWTGKKTKLDEWEPDERNKQIKCQIYVLDYK